MITLEKVRKGLGKKNQDSKRSWCMKAYNYKVDMNQGKKIHQLSKNDKVTMA